MHWKGLRLVADGSSKRQGPIEPPHGRRSEHLPRPSPPDTEPRLSESNARSAGLPQHDGSPDSSSRLDLPATGDDDHTEDHSGAASPSHGNPPSMRRHRFSFMRFRHASDPQLSKSYSQAEQDAPPVPSLPPPTIITTAPTSHDLEQPPKRSIFTLGASSRQGSIDEISRGSTERPRTSQRPPRNKQGSTDSSLSGFQGNMDEQVRLSTSMRSGGRDHPNDSTRSSLTDPRFSESSRSDQSYGDQATFQTNSPRDGYGSTSSSRRFRLPRLGRNRSPLFPLPPKPTPMSQSLDSAPKFLPPDPHRLDGAGENDQVSPLPSPTRSSVALATHPPLSRNDSTNSAQSLRSNPSHNVRSRSSTMGSVAENQEDLSPVPYMVSSGRTSTSTTGRKSFGDLFSFPQRLRQNSEPPIPRHGSPGVGGASTPVSTKPDLPPVPEREESDTPASYLTKLEENLPRGMVGGVLSQSDDDFFKVALRKYMRSFAYFGDPIDMAIRKLLMEVDLPKETQQIDRFLQSFADRYHECNPGIFANTDQAYFIAFSILILHTDVFNKNNKRKMQKPDYVKNTRGEGISEDILECFYENISYTPFIHVEDANLRDRHLARPKRALFTSTSSENLARSSREPVDPYALIMDGKLESLRPSLKEVMDLDDMYNHNGTAGPPDMENLHLAFTKSGILQIISARSRPDAFMQGRLDSPADSNPGLVDIKVAKVGLLWRKDPRKKRARSPWAEWGAVLTFSQLYFFRNVTWVRSLMAQHDAYVKNEGKHTLVFRPPLAEFKPDAIMSTNDAVALLDTGYKKHKYAFQYVRPNALEEVFLAQSETEMNDWIAKLNYAAAFRTTGVRTKGMIATNYEGQRYRQSQQRVNSSSSLNSHQSSDMEPPTPSIDRDIVAEFVAARRELMSQRIREANEKLFVSQRQLEDLLRNARHLQILTPVHQRAREGVIMAAGRMAAKLKWVRQEIWRHKCYREVLLRDLDGNESFYEGGARSVGESSAAIPSGPSILSESNTQRAPSIVRTVSSHETAEQVPQIVDKPEPGLLKQPSTEDLRRPSIPSSTTSSEPARIGRPLSIAQVSEQGGKSEAQLEREASVLSRGSKFDTTSLGSRTSKLTSPVSYDDGEERLLREAGLLELSGSPPPRRHSAVPEPDVDGRIPDFPESYQSDKQNRGARRSLQRSLRQAEHHVSRHHSYHNHRKNKGSVSSGGPLDGEDGAALKGEGLSRKSKSFTVHGKKASIVTFGSEWQNMPPEERLRLRKPTPHEEPRASEPTLETALVSGESLTSDNIPPERPRSTRTVSTTTRLSVRSDEIPSPDDFKDAHESPPDEASVPPSNEPEQDGGPGPVTIETENPSSSSPFGTHLAASVDDAPISPSTTPLSERAVETPPSPENLMQQAVGA